MKKNVEEFVKKVEKNSNDILEDTLLDKEASLEDTRGFSYDDIVKISAKDKMSKLPWLTAIFLIFIISLTLGYMFFRYNPQTLFISVTDKFFTFITDRISENSYDITKGKLYFDYSNGVDNISVKIKYTLDGANNLSKFNIDDKVDVYSDGKYLYVNDKELYDGYLKFESSSVDKVKLTDLKTVLVGINQALDKVSTSEKITGGKTNYDLGNKTIRVYESKLLIDNKNYDRVVSTFMSSLKSNEEFVSALSKITGFDVKNRVDDFSLKLKRYLKDNNLEIKIYTDTSNNDFIKCEVSDNNGSVVLTEEDIFNISLDTEFLKGTLNIYPEDDLKIKFDLSGIGKGEISLKTSEADSFGKVNVDKAIDYADLSEEEKLAIYSKALESPYYGKYIKWFK